GHRSRASRAVVLDRPLRRRRAGVVHPRPEDGTRPDAHPTRRRVIAQPARFLESKYVPPVISNVEIRPAKLLIPLLTSPGVDRVASLPITAIVEGLPATGMRDRHYRVVRRQCRIPLARLR